MITRIRCAWAFFSLKKPLNSWLIFTGKEKLASWEIELLLKSSRR
jgi:hypothetical protein